MLCASGIVHSATMRGSEMIYGMPALLELNTLEENCRLCAKLGLNFLELNMNLPQFQLPELENIKHLADNKKKYGIEYTIHLDENLNICDFNYLVSDAYMNTVKRTIDAAKKLDIHIINLHMNHGVYFTLPDRRVYLFDKYKDRYCQQIQRFKEMCEKEAKDSEIVLTIENTDGFTSFEKEAVDLLVKSSHFGLTWDIGHSHACQDADEEYIVSHMDKLVHFHIHDGRKKENHLPLGTGEIDLIGRLDMARKNHCRCVIETKTVDALKTSVEWLMNNGL